MLLSQQTAASALRHDRAVIKIGGKIKMIFKKIFIGISLILSLSAAAAFASELPFNDVTEQTPYYSAVDRLYNMGIIS